MIFDISRKIKWKGRRGQNLGKHLARTPLKIRFAYIAIEIDKIRERLGK